MNRRGKESSSGVDGGSAASIDRVQAAQTDGATAWQRFRANRLAFGGLIVAVGLFTVASLAPFLAGNRPILFVGEKGCELPIFKAFTREDALWFTAFSALFLSALLVPLLSRFKPALGRAIRRKGAVVLASLLLALTLLILAIVWPERLVHDDYRPYRDGSKEARFCLFPPVPYSPSELPLKGILLSPCEGHWLGTDRQGDDLLARLVHGARISLIVGLAAVSVCIAIGVFLGALAGYFGGKTDAMVLRLIEVTTCFPAFFAVLAVLAFLPPRIMWVMILIGLVRWPGVARLTRGEFLKLRGMEFVTAARAIGLSNGRIIFRHMLPNALGPVIVSATFGMAGAILIESALSFLGIAPATCQSWGRLLSEFRPYFDVAWWLSVFPGVGIFVTVTAFNLIGEGLRDAFDPRLRGER
jgi:peptide/nickel transport system permease protein